MSQAELIPAQAVVVQPQQMPAVMTPAHMLAIAVEQGADLDRLQKLMDLQDRWEAAQARKAFAAAVAGFKADPPKLTKNKHVRFTTSKGVTEYDHATHDEVCDKISKALAAHGLSHRWNVEQVEGRIRVTCYLTHVAGHSESVQMTSNPDDSGGKNGIQGIASAVTYLQRYTLLAITGMSTGDANEDDDGRGTGGDDKPVPTAPDDYEDWRADMTALADEGLPALQEGWRRSAPDLRQYASIVDAAWWTATKARASTVRA
jgi:hypothetical protein